MPICENWNNKWSWKQTIKKTTTLNLMMICSYCGEKQYQTQKSKLKISLLTPIVLFPLLITILFDASGAVLFSLYPAVLLVFLLVYPFLVKLHSTEEYINFSKDKQ